MYLYSPRSGKGISKQVLVDGLLKVFNLDYDLATKLVNGAFDMFHKDHQIDLDELSEHGFIEHDASLVHRDTNIGNNSVVDKQLLNQLIGLTDGHQLTLGNLHDIRKLREKQCSLENKGYTFGLKEQATAYGEASLLLLTMGNGTWKAPIPWVKSFLGDERIPDDYVRPKDPIGLGTVAFLAGRIKLGF
jgi:hypothetical protein